MVINHSTAHIPGDIVPSADWNAGHIIDGNAKEVLFRDAAGNIDTASNLVYDPATGYVGIGIAIPTQQLQLTKNIKLTDTTFASQNGIIYKGATPFMHNFNYGDNGTVTTSGYNTFVGGAGNLTMGSTATQTYHASYNTGIGYQSLYSNTTGRANIAMGYFTLNKNTSGYQNSALGLQSLYYNTTGYNNSALGVYSLYSNTTGYQNTANGYQAGRFIADGSTANETSTTSVYLGANTKANASGDTNEIVIGDSAIGQGSNTIMLGNSSITGLYCYDTSIASPSDRRVKENITEIGDSKLLDFITKLEPITYNKKNQCDWDNDIKLSNYKDIEVDEIEEYEEVIKGETVKKQRTVKKIHKAEKRPETDTKTYAGMVAQDVEIAMVESGVDYELVNTADNGMKTLRYGDLIPALIGAVKAQQTQIENLQIEVDRLTNSK